MPNNVTILCHFTGFGSWIPSPRLHVFREMVLHDSSDTSQWRIEAVIPLERPAFGLLSPKLARAFP